LRTKPGKVQKFRKHDESPDAVRRRRSSANRVLTVLKAALNHAHHARKVSSDDAWRSVKAFREADSARVRYLNDDEARRVVNHCSPEFRPLAQAALLTGCRYGELVALTVADYNADAGTVHVRVSKSGKPRHVVLTDEGRRFFDGVIAGKIGGALAFTKADGSRWGASHQQRPFKAACEGAKVGTLTFHELRHTDRVPGRGVGAALPSCSPAG
jgi:integrase